MSSASTKFLGSPSTKGTACYVAELPSLNLRDVRIDDQLVRQGFEPSTPTLARLCSMLGRLRFCARSQVEVWGTVYWRKVGDVIKPSIEVNY
jgi:hypothetical protein